ncbi:MAG: HemK2/MTQ2 family protein methyltransferase [Candidatus Nanohaloarchaea archaeon]|nr:HemK2/MTQ2 family protein methyltransferase [Candidatus Nanohaloarchaea archaeon]
MQFDDAATVPYTDLEFHVPDGIYLPREDSYLLANMLKDHDLAGKSVLDIGTGCGFIAVIAASDGADVTATDINEKALETAKANAERNDVAIKTLKSDLFEQVDGRYDIITFNAPYLPGSRDDAEMEELTWLGGEDGREVIDRFIDKAPAYLTEEGLFLLVQSSVSDTDATLERLEERDMHASIAGRKKVSWEEIVVVKASKI